MSMRHRPSAVLALLVLLNLHRPGIAADEMRTGSSVPTPQRVTFAESSPFTGLEEYCRRTRQSPAAYKREGNEHEYILADESFQPSCRSRATRRIRTGSSFGSALAVRIFRESGWRCWSGTS